eukprot:TRINITY_DN7754_c0_g1_i1.p1 TRINITY_DN7754_c0_g1~~TRINITY_DN7754_c0_g1_i1.p1  ORF type:complete len:208 (+),score=5.14 TRINITY_DN7754_c0_g1_i1:38-661(+)
MARDSRSVSPRRSRSRSPASSRSRSRSRSASPRRRRSRSRSASPYRRRRSYSRSPTPRRSPSPVKPKELWVGQLSGNVNAAHLEEIFNCYGKVIRVDMPKDRHGSTRYFGYVEYDTHDEASKAIDYLNGSQLDGKKISVELKRVPERSSLASLYFHCDSDYDFLPGDLEALVEAEASAIVTADRLPGAIEDLGLLLGVDIKTWRLKF